MQLHYGEMLSLKNPGLVRQNVQLVCDPVQFKHLYEHSLKLWNSYFCIYLFHHRKILTYRDTCLGYSLSQF